MMSDEGDLYGDSTPMIKKELECNDFCSHSPAGDIVYSPNIDQPNQDDLKEYEDSPRRLCLVCGDIASGFHYGVASCEACKAFFKRTIQGNIEYTCPAGNECEINKRRRKACQACRFQKCLRKGMLKEGVRLDRVRGGRQKYRRNAQISLGAPTSSPQRKSFPSLEDNKLLEMLVAWEPEPLTGFNVDRNPGNLVLSTLNALSEIYDKELVSIISWAKQIPGFTDLSLKNQMRLLKSTWTEILTLTLAYRSMPPCGKLNFALDLIVDEKLAQKCGAHEIFRLCIIIMEKLQMSSVSKEEYLLMKALVLANSDVRLDEVTALKQFKNSIVSSLTESMSKTRGNGNEITTLLLCLPTLRQTDIVVRRFWRTIHQAGTVIMNKLFVEMLEPSLRY